MSQLTFTVGLRNKFMEVVDMGLVDDFKRRYGEEIYRKTIERAGIHSSVVGSLAAGEKLPDDEESRLVFALLEILDYECCKCDCYPYLTEEEIKKFLLDHRDEVLKLRIPPPSYLGVLVGVYNFLFEE